MSEHMTNNEASADLNELLSTSEDAVSAALKRDADEGLTICVEQMAGRQADSNSDNSLWDASADSWLTWITWGTWITWNTWAPDRTPGRNPSPSPGIDDVD